VKPSAALAINREAVRAAVSRRKAANPRVFGSVLRGEDKEGSDIDILEDALPGATLLDLGGLMMDLQDILGVRVDLMTPQELPKRIRAKVIAEAAPI
jgi:predicted nucleotidyltransferase